jgi:haloacetate dehalogenase
MMFAGFARKIIEVGDGIAINCVIGGNTAATKPPVLLLHGYPQNLSMWAEVAPLIAEDYTVVCADLRGYGDSAKPRGLPDYANYTFRAMAADQVAVMKALGFDRFHVAGHDRGARVAHRMTLDHPAAVASMTVMDIAPTYTTYTAPNRDIARGYWMWYLLCRPEPLPETLIGANPDFFFESLLGSLGASSFRPEQLEDYRRCWRNPEMIHAGCCDYRAAITLDLAMDTADHGHRKVTCPALALWGETGAPARYFDVEACWREWCTDLRGAALPSGHFFIDALPRETAAALTAFWASL